MGQLLVVACHTVCSKPSSCYEPELIPDPLRAHLNNVHFQLDGSGISANTEEPQRGVVADP